MKKKMILLIAGLLIVVLLAGCSSSKSEDNAVAPSEKQITYATTTAAYKGEMGFGENVSYDGDGLGELGDNLAFQNRKVILNARLTLEVEHFDTAYTQIKTMIAPYGYVQESSISKDKYYPEGSQEYIYITRGVVVIRVDSAKFEQTMENINGIGTVLDERRGSDDITYAYTDTEARIRLLEDEQSRLEEYLKDRTKDADFIFKIQSRLTDVLYQIENLKGTIQKWDDLIGLSTITIDMREKVPGQKPFKEYTYWDRFLQSFKQALDICGDIIIFIISAIPVILIVGALVVIVIVVIRLIRRIPLISKGKKDQKPKKPAENDKPKDQ